MPELPVGKSAHVWLRHAIGGWPRYGNCCRGRALTGFDSDFQLERCQSTAERYSKGVINILVGTTRMLGFAEHLRSDLIGVVQADFGLAFPDYQAPERVYQTLSRLRDAGLEDNIEGSMLLQTSDPGHYVIEAVRTGSYLRFFRAEIDLRRRYRMPPFRELTRFVLRSRI